MDGGSESRGCVSGVQSTLWSLPSPGLRGLGPHQGHHIEPFHNWGHHSTHMYDPHSVAEARDTMAGQVGQPRAAAACGSKVGWDRRPESTLEILDGVRYCLSPKARCLEAGATPTSSN